MALIQCPECHREVSDHAGTCPQCSYPFGHQAVPSLSDLDGRIRELLASKGKIAAIKLYRDHAPGVSLVDAKNYVERLEGSRPNANGASQDSTQRGIFSGCFHLFLVTLVALVVWVIEPPFHRSEQIRFQEAPHKQPISPASSLTQPKSVRG